MRPMAARSRSFPKMKNMKLALIGCVSPLMCIDLFAFTMPAQRRRLTLSLPR